MTDTGLPELPDNYFWRVNNYGVEIRERLPDTEWSVPRDNHDIFLDYAWDSPEDSVRETRTVEAEERTVVGHLFWKRFKNTTKYVRQERFTNRSTRVYKMHTDYSGETYTTRPYASRTTFYVPETIKLRLPVTKESLPALCEKALEGWNADKEAKELLGDYPPKKLT